MSVAVSIQKKQAPAFAYGTRLSVASLEIRLLSIYTLSDFLQTFVEFLRHAQQIFHIQEICSSREWVSRNKVTMDWMNEKLRSPVNTELLRNSGKDKLKSPVHGSLGCPLPVCGCGHTAQLG